MRKPIVLFGLSAVAAALILGTALSGCQQLFTTSLASGLARDSISLPKTLTTDQAADLAQQAEDNSDPVLAAAVVDTLVDQITDPAAQPELAAAAASAAITASGTSSAILDAFSEAMGGGTIDAAALLADIQAGATADVLEALSFMDPTDGIPDPSALDGTELEATDYLIAAVVVAASAIPEGTDLETFDPGSLDPSASATFDSAVAILGQAIAMVEPGSSAADLLDQLSGILHIE